jgi:glutamate-1-semialdehyde 2,1-aminomutase
MLTSTSLIWPLLALAAIVTLLPAALRRLELSRAKHPSIAGHAKLSRRLAAQMPFVSYDEHKFFACDGAPDDVVAQRRAAFDRLAAVSRQRTPASVALTAELEHGLSDVLFTDTYRIPFQFREHVRRHLKIGSVVEDSRGTQLKDLDGNWSYDLSGSYGVNLFGYDFYKNCIAAGAARVADLGPVLGPYHPLIRDNVSRIKAISGLDEVSFHMSGTEAVMQAVRLAQFHTRRQRVVLFCGAYHGWWDGVQPGLGNRRRVNDVYTLKEISARTLHVLATRKDIACVLVNPLQALHPNASAPGDASLIDGGRAAAFDRGAYAEWLRQLRQVCTERGIVLIFDEVFLGFRLARGGAQEYFGVRADLVTYGKTLGGGLPIGVLCGKREYMKRFRDDRPTDGCFARGTFNSHPYVMATMNEFLLRLDTPELRATYVDLDARWNERARVLNARLTAAGAPVRVANMVSVWTVLYDRPSRYNWMFQYYLRAEGLALSWVGTGRLILSHNYSHADYAEVVERFTRAAEKMLRDGWWWAPAGATNKSVRRTILRELLRAKFGGGREAQAATGTAVTERP